MKPSTKLYIAATAVALAVVGSLVAWLAGLSWWTPLAGGTGEDVVRFFVLVMLHAGGALLSTGLLLKAETYEGMGQ